jgi:hypothetical protein
MFYTHMNLIGTGQLNKCLCVRALIESIFGVDEQN